MGRPNLKIVCFRVVSNAASHKFRLRLVTYVVSSSALCIDAKLNFIEPRQHDLQFFLCCMIFLTCRHFCQLAFDYGEHFANCEEYSTRKFVLIVSLQEPRYVVSDVRLENLGRGKFFEVSVSQNVVVLLGLRFSTERICISCCRLHLAENLLGFLRIGLL